MKEQLISRKALLDEIDRRQKDDPYKKLRGPVERWIRRWGYDILWTIVRYFPAADAVEVKYGCWMEPGGFYEEENVYTCTNCDFALQLMVEGPEENGYKFCPHCGAKMYEDGDT